MTEKEEGAQGLALSIKSNLESIPTQENILEEFIHWRGHPRRHQEEKIKWEGLMESPALCPNNVAQRYELGTKL